MANIVLFRSSCISGFIHLMVQLYSQQNNPILLTISVLGVITSIWNHNVTHVLAKYADRIMMFAGFCIDLFFITIIINDIIIANY